MGVWVDLLNGAEKGSWGGCGIFVFASSLSFCISFWVFFNYGWTSMVISYILLCPLIACPMLLIAYFLREREKRISRKDRD